MDYFCRQFVEDIFLKYDKDRNYILEKKELNGWTKEYVQTHPFFNKKLVQKDFEMFFRKVDTSHDGKIDRWELYNYCIKNIKPEDD